MKTVTPVTIRASRVCGYIRPKDIEAAEFTIDDTPATVTQTAMLRKKISVAQKGVFGREICTAYVLEGNVLMARASIGGVAQPTMDQKVIWVSPEDGFKVQP